VGTSKAQAADPGSQRPSVKVQRYADWHHKKARGGWLKPEPLPKSMKYQVCGLCRHQDHENIFELLFAIFLFSRDRIILLFH
jgi:hypothetical protein